MLGNPSRAQFEKIVFVPDRLIFPVLKKPRYGFHFFQFFSNSIPWLFCPRQFSCGHGTTRFFPFARIAILKRFLSPKIKTTLPSRSFTTTNLPCPPPQDFWRKRKRKRPLTNHTTTPATTCHPHQIPPRRCGGYVIHTSAAAQTQTLQPSP